LQYIKQLMSKSSMISNAFAIFLLPLILLFSLLQFSPIIQNIPCCFVLGADPCIWRRPSLTALRTCLCSSFAASLALPLSPSTSVLLPSLMSLIISSESWSSNLPCFLNWFALIHNCSIIDKFKVGLNFLLIHRFFNFIHVDNN
jgi:hypothetical protein